MPAGEGDPQLAFASAADWERWLERHHADAGGVWMELAKKGSGIACVGHSEALDIALCFGWIDAQLRPLDERRYLHRFMPRRPGSRWSQRNRARVEALERAGRMRAAGALEVERARADGRWEAAYPAQRDATVPEDLRVALDANPPAREFFAGLDSANRYAILYRLHEARRPQTRAARIERFVAMLAAGETLH